MLWMSVVPFAFLGGLSFPFLRIPGVLFFGAFWLLRSIVFSTVSFVLGSWVPLFFGRSAVNKPRLVLWIVRTCVIGPRRSFSFLGPSILVNGFLSPTRHFRRHGHPLLWRRRHDRRRDPLLCLFPYILKLRASFPVSRPCFAVHYSFMILCALDLHSATDL